MFGNNKPLAFKRDYNQHLDVVEIFRTIQGEGPYSGHPAIFIRLGGCNLKCKFCDTEFDNYSNMHVNEIITQTKQLANNTIKLVVITGGEPLRQDITELCNLLIAAELKPQIETNASLYRELDPKVIIIASPKNHNGNGYRHINQKLKQRADYFKFIISKNNSDYNHVPEEFFSYNNVYIQPMDEYDDTKNSENQKLCVELAIKHNFKISLQTHKILKIA